MPQISPLHEWRAALATQTACAWALWKRPPLGRPLQSWGERSYYKDQDQESWGDECSFESDLEGAGCVYFQLTAQFLWGLARGQLFMKCYFHHEKLEVYQIAIEFVAWSEWLLENCRGKASAAKRHLEEASGSIPNNIAEGNGKWSKRDRKKFFEIARGSALECASCLDVLVARERVDRSQISAGKEKLNSVVNILTRMIKNLAEES